MAVSADLPRFYRRELRLGYYLRRALGALAFGLVVCCAAALLVAAQVYLLTTQRVVSGFAISSREADQLLTGVHALEADARGDFRWSSGHSQIRFEQVARGDALVLVLGLGPPP